MNSLRAASGSAASLSHETKLGMMVITILFFAFCFLVYHKMDLHQRQLTQASIQPTAETPSERSLLDTEAQLEAQSHASAATDPLTAISDLRSGSTFADSEELTSPDQFDAVQSLSAGTPGVAAPPSEFVVQQETPDGPAEAFSFSEPTAETISEPEDGFESVPAATAIADAGKGAVSEPTSLDFDEPTFDADSSSVITRAPASSSTRASGKVPSSFDSEVSALETGDSEAGQLGSSDATVASDSAEPEMVFDTSMEEPSDAFVAETPSGSEFPGASDPSDFESRALADTVPDFGDVPDFGGSAEDAVTTENTIVSESGLVAEYVPDDSTRNAETNPELDNERTDEPVMIAMLDPQQGNGFSDGFLAADDVNSADSSSSEPALDSPPSFPGLESSESASEPVRLPEPRSAAAGQRANPFGNRGFDAVTQPGGRSHRNSLRTASGSGADGKFSLAAFNHQNNSATPPPDDGSTFPSVVVQNGDNYSKISKRVYGTVRYFSALAVFNQHRIAEPKHMRPGMIVLTPPREILEERYPQLFVDSQPKAAVRAEFLLLEDGSPAYRVGERETLSEISERFLGRSSRWVEIFRLNQPNVKDPNKLKPGLILALPADATEVHVMP